ncbi:glycosyltransferase [Rariglobus hedericola]
MQRARLAIPYLKEHGWEPVVLAIAPEFIEGGVLDPLLEATYPADTRIIRVRGISPKLTRWLGIGSLWLRCGRAFRIAGEKLLAKEKFDLVFFTTTQFDAFKLGPLWKRKFGVPYVLDYQDPWVNDYYERTRTKPPGGALKFAFAQWRARQQEPETLRESSGVVAVSDAYGRNLAAHYPWFSANQVRLLPFGAAAKDIATARQHTPAKPVVDFNDGCFHHIYAGRCGPDMSISLTTIFRAFKNFREHNPQKAASIRFHFIGTDYAPPPLGREWAMPIARAEGVADHVTEHCYRVPYFDALYYLVKADALLAVGSNDPTYSASKIFPYILAERPMIVVFNRHSPVLAFAKQADCGERFSFDNADDIDEIARQIEDVWFNQDHMHLVREPNVTAFLPFTAESMTTQLVSCFNSAVSASNEQ